MPTIRLLLILLALTWSASAVTRSVGPGRPYATPCAAIAAAVDGDVIEIDAAGSYNGNVCAITRNNLTIRGIGGRAKIDAAGKYVWGKGIWVVAGDNTVIENIEFSGAQVPDRNGAGIRLDSGNLTVRNCSFHDNENGILGGFYGSVLIEHSEFFNNGYGDGYSHNIYLNGGVEQLTMRYSLSRSSRLGHLLKSRAAANYIHYNRFSQENGTGSYEIDLPNAGLAYVIGNVIQQGESTANRGMLTFGTEGTRSVNQLNVVNNTFVSTRSAGATFVQIGGGVTTPALIRNNIFSGPGILTTQAAAQLSGNVSSGDMAFVNPANFDFHITNISAALNAGVEPGTSGGVALNPAMQYFHPLCGETRNNVGPIDSGAFEYGVIGGNPLCAAAAEPPPPPPAAPVLSTFVVAPAEVAGGAAAVGTITLSTPAGASGVVVTLMSSSPAIAKGPATVTVASGQTSASFNVQTFAVTSSTLVTFSAALDGTALSAALSVKPPAPPPPPPPPPSGKFATFTVSPQTVAPGGKFQVKVQLTAPAPAGGLVVALYSTSGDVRLPSIVRFAAGGTIATTPGTVASGASAQSVLLRAKAIGEVWTTLTIKR
jgi:hypothetical protein